MTVKSAADHAFDLLVDSHTLVVVDVETTPSDDGDHIIQLAAITCRRGRIRETYATNVNPGVPITNSYFHGITDTDVADAPTFAEIADDLERLLADGHTMFVAHNATFDLGRIHLEYDRGGLPGRLPDRPVLDTQRLVDAVGHVMPSTSRRLSAVCSSLGVVNSNPHTAAGDATATAEALHALLRTAAANGQVSLPALHQETGGVTTTGVQAAAATGRTATPTQPDLPAKHLKTHSGRRLGKTAAGSTLDRWTRHATECIELRCLYLQGKADDATHHAKPLHDRLTDLLAANADTLEPGQGGTLMGALNVLARHALVGGARSTTASAWWRRHRDHVRGLASCDVEQDACPDCRQGHPCPIDIAHQPVVTAILYRDGDTLTNERRKKVSSQSKTAFITVWTRWGCNDLAGYAAWLAADSWMVLGNHRRADAVVDHAMSTGAHDPRILLAYARRLVLQGRDDEATELVAEHLEGATTDPGWRDLHTWVTRHAARQHSDEDQPTDDDPAHPRLARPAGRTRQPRFTV